MCSSDLCARSQRVPCNTRATQSGLNSPGTRGPGGRSEGIGGYTRDRGVSKVNQIEIEVVLGSCKGDGRVGTNIVNQRRLGGGAGRIEVGRIRKIERIRRS